MFARVEKVWGGARPETILVGGSSAGAESRGLLSGKVDFHVEDGERYPVWSSTE